jgi:hypothetical protein
MVLWAMSKEGGEGGVREHDGTQRSMSTVWITVVQKERTHSHGQTKSSLQSGWPGLCADARTCSHHRRTTRADRTPTLGEQVESAKVEFPGSNLPAQWINIKPDYTQPNHYNLDIRNVMIPSDIYAVWSPIVTLCGDPTSGAANNCEVGTEIFTYTMNGQITADSGASTTSSSSADSDMDFFEKLAAWFEKFFKTTQPAPTPTPTPAPTVSPLCAQFSACSSARFGAYGASGLQSFLISHGYGIPAGATGYYGSQTAAAVSAFQAVNHCAL